MSTTTHTEINGIDVIGMAEIAEGINSTPDLAQFQYRATNQWIDGGLNRTTIDGFYGVGKERGTATYVFDNDTPQVLCGHQRGASPAVFMLHALAGCFTTTLVYTAAAEGIHVESVEAKIAGNIDVRGVFGLDPDVRRGYNNIQIALKVRADAPDDVIDRLIETTRDRSPLFETVTTPVPVAITRDR
jgi:uncharacterized OsmC-like protein